MKRTLTDKTLEALWGKIVEPSKHLRERDWQLECTHWVYSVEDDIGAYQRVILITEWVREKSSELLLECEAYENGQCAHWWNCNLETQDTWFSVQSKTNQ